MRLRRWGALDLAADLDGEMGDRAGIVQVRDFQGLKEIGNVLRPGEIGEGVDQPGAAGDGERHAVIGADERIELQTQARLVRLGIAVLHDPANQHGVEQAARDAADHRRLAGGHFEDLMNAQAARFIGGMRRIDGSGSGLDAILQATLIEPYPAPGSAAQGPRQPVDPDHGAVALAVGRKGELLRQAGRAGGADAEIAGAALDDVADQRRLLDESPAPARCLRPARP